MNLKRMKLKIRNLLRKLFDKKNIKRLTNQDFTIICNNCTAGVIYHYLNKKFMTPTINLYMHAGDFIKLVKNLDYYLNQDLIEITQMNFNYPVVKLADLVMYCVHYQNFEDFKLKWDERKRRINRENMYIMMTERDYCENQYIIEFDNLPYKNKVIFTRTRREDIKSSFYIPNSEIMENGVCVTRALTDYLGKFTGYRWIDKFDYVEWLNSGKKRLTDI